MARNLRIFLDTSVISYLDQQDTPEEMEETRRAWEVMKRSGYEIYISDLVLSEIERCDEGKRDRLLSYLDELNYTIVEVDDETFELAERIIDYGVLKQRNINDCNHIAAAILCDCDFILSWNFKHIVNIKTVRGVKVITTMEGYKDLLIYPPYVLLEEEDYENNG